MLSYRVTLDIPSQLVMFVSGLLARRRHEIGTRRGTRALTCSRQAVFALAWFRDRPDVRRLGQGFGISQATAYRYLGEAIEVLAAKAPSLRAGAGVHVPVKQPAGGRCLDINTQTRNALLRSLRYQGERGFALMTQRWRTLRRVMLSPGKIGSGS